jgi:hypothetical protein
MLFTRKIIGYNIHNCLKQYSTNVIKTPIDNFSKNYRWIKENKFNTHVLNPTIRTELSNINKQRHADSIYNIKPKLDKVIELNNLVYVLERHMPILSINTNNIPEYIIKNNLYKIGSDGKKKFAYRVIGGEFLKKWIEYKNLNLIMIPEQWEYKDHIAICKKIKREPEKLYTCDQIKQLISLMQVSGYMGAKPDNIMYCNGKIAIIDTELTGFLQYKFALSNTTIKNVEDWTMCAIKHIVHVLKLLKNHSTYEANYFMDKRICEYEKILDNNVKSRISIKKKFLEYEKNIYYEETNSYSHGIDLIIYLYLISYDYNASIRTIIEDNNLIESRRISYCRGQEIGGDCPCFS